jgi:ribose-phosphate pyrophosphokinase
LVEKGATVVIAIITHGILAGDALERIQSSPLTKVIVSNTVPQVSKKTFLYIVDAYFRMIIC